MGRAPQRRSSVCRIGFIGTGGVAARHAGVLAGFDDVQLVAATDVDPARAVAFGEQHGVGVAADVADLLRHGLDAVYVCVPPIAHGAPELALVEAGTALFVEKPLAVDEPVAARVAERIAAADLLSRVGHHWRCAEPVRRARELLRGRAVRLVSGWWLDKVPPVPWWSDRARSGGPVVEQAVHLLDLARHLVGEIVEVSGTAAPPVPGGTAPLATAAVLRFAGGAVGTVATSCALAGKHRAGLEIVADDLVVAVGEDFLEVGDGQSAARRTEFDPWPARVAADRAFIDAWRAHGGRPGSAADPAGPPDYGEALRTHRVACAIARSIDSGGPERPA